MRRASRRSAASCSTAMRARFIATARIGGSTRQQGRLDAGEAVVALGPWAPDLLEPLGIDLPLAVKRGYHRHFRPRGNAGLTRPVVDAEIGYCVAPMEQGLRLTTGAEFAARDAPPTPVQFDRLMPAAKALFPLGEPVEAAPWMGSRPCFADSRPVIGRAPGQAGPVARLWPRPLGSHARPGHRAAAGRDDDRRRRRSATRRPIGRSGSDSSCTGAVPPQVACREFPARRLRRATR